jgi:uncharacterized protein Yka (UPF0111/DUF47 family)
MGLQDIVRFFLPREDHFYGFLEQQASVAHEGAKALSLFGDGNIEQVRTAVQALEHQGDGIVHQMEEALAKTFVTPIDREDLHHLSSELDDILDLTNGSARACSLLGVTRPTEPMTILVKNLVECTGVLAAAIPKLRLHAYPEIMEASRQVRSLEKEADRVFRDAISALFHDPAVDAKTILREKQVLEDLESAIDHCDHVANILTNLAVKHG